ncbi:hypothetical protein [Photorhabdus laumondii]|uniref:hypothetical protein n=1 Tax=Photorhabdus laumondii TaxID=2218628 RepID=UPI003315A04C
MTVCLCDHTFARDAALTSVLLNMQDPAQATDRPVHQFFGEGIQGPVCLFSMQSEQKNGWRISLPGKPY